MTARSRPTRALRLAQLVAGLNVMVVLAGTVMILALQGRPDVGRAQLNALVYSLLAVLIIARHPRRVQCFIDRRFYRRNYDAEQALARFAAATRDEVNMDELTAAMLGVVQETVQPEHLSLWLPQHEGWER